MTNEELISLIKDLLAELRTMGNENKDLLARAQRIVESENIAKIE